MAMPPYGEGAFTSDGAGAGRRAAAPWLPASLHWLGRNMTFQNTSSVFLSTLMGLSEKFVHLHLQDFYRVRKYCPYLTNEHFGQRGAEMCTG